MTAPRRVNKKAASGRFFVGGRRRAAAYLLVPESVPVAPAVPESPVLLPLPLPEPLVDVPEAAPFALGEEEPEDCSFLAFLACLLFCFFACFLAFGLVSAVASLAPADEPEVAPAEPLPVEDVPAALGEPELVPVVVSVPVVDDDPEAPVPLVPDAPEVVSLEPDALEPDVPLPPDEPDAPGWPECGGIEVEVPLPPAMPASLPVPAPVAPVALCCLTVDEVSEVLLPDCANAMDDTDATTISDRERRVVFNVMSNSF